MTVRIDIPGGWAELFTEDEVTGRRLKPLTRLSLLSGSVIKKIQDEEAAAKAEGRDAASVPPGLTEEEADRFTDLQYATAWAYLAAWDRGDVPDKWEDMLDVPQKVATALATEVNKIKSATAEEFTPAAGADPESPTSA